MFKPKITKGEKPKTGKYLLYNTTEVLNIGDKESVTVVSIDPAKKNMGFRIERRNFGDHRINTIVWDKMNLVDEDPVQCDFFYLRLTAYLQQYDDLVKDADLIIIERQLSINYQSVRMSQHVITYYLTKFPQIPFADIDPHVKGWALSAPPGLGKYALKQWAVEKAYDLLTTRQDEKGLAVLETFRKKKHKLDDLSDALIQIEALFKLWNLPLTKTPLPRVKLILHPNE